MGAAGADRVRRAAAMPDLPESASGVGQALLRGAALAAGAWCCRGGSAAAAPLTRAARGGWPGKAGLVPGIWDAGVEADGLGQGEVRHGWSWQAAGARLAEG
jgi:hypothetical protein